MQTKEVTIGDMKFKIKEISLDDSLELGNVKEPNEITKRLLQIAVDPPITDEQRKNIPMKTGLLLVKEINELNGLTEGFLSSLKTT